HGPRRHSVAGQAGNLAEGAAHRAQGERAQMMGAHTMNRREFLGLSSAAALAVLYPGATASALAGLARSAEGTLVVADHRYSDSLSFARALGNRGASVFSIKEGLAGVWFDDLAPRLAAGSHKLAGLTLESELFVLERLAESCGLRPCYVGRHDWRAKP